MIWNRSSPNASLTHKKPRPTVPNRGFFTAPYPNKHFCKTDPLFYKSVLQSVKHRCFTKNCLTLKKHSNQEPTRLFYKHGIDLLCLTMWNMIFLWTSNKPMDKRFY